ncbi:MAG: hypothetical protein GF381_03610 [Candidatus Pacebacteria bacterium]|nr:hypothetical protein [Candidatus Paceibacterota bacterium]
MARINQNNHGTVFLILLLAFLAGVLGYNYFKTPFLKYFDQRQVAVTDEFQPTPVKPASPSQVLAELSTAEKISQLMAVSVPVASESGQLNLAAVSQLQPGLVVIDGQHISSSLARTAISQLKSELKRDQLELLVAVNHEGGSAQALSGSGFANLPTWSQACQQPLEQLENSLDQSAQELAAVGVNLVLGPNLDLARPGYYLGSRGCPDQEKLAEAALTYIKAMGQQQLMPVVKYYPGTGRVQANPYQTVVTTQVDSQDTDLYRYILETAPNIGVMTSHVRLQNKFSQMPCSQSPDCLSPFGQTYQQVLLMTAPLEMESAKIAQTTNQVLATNSAQQAEAQSSVQDSLADRSYRSLMAGNHLIYFGSSVETDKLQLVIDQLVARYQAEPAFAQQVDQALLRVISLKYHPDDQN